MYKRKREGKRKTLKGRRVCFPYRIMKLRKYITNNDKKNKTVTRKIDKTAIQKSDKDKENRYIRDVFMSVMPGQKGGICLRLVYARIYY